MELSLIQTFLLSLFISFMAVETYWWGGAIYIARPVFAGPLIGLILGDLPTGLAVGASVELVFLGGLSMGAYAPPNPYIGGMVGVALAIISGSPELGITLAYPIGLLVQMLNYVVTSINIIWVEKAEALLKQGKTKGVWFWHHMSIWTRMILQFFVPTFIALWVGSTAVQGIYDSIPAWFSGGLSVAAGILPAIGMASILVTLGFKKAWPFFILGYVLAAYMGLSTVPVALIALAVAVIVYGLKRSKGDEAEEADDKLIDSPDLDKGGCLDKGIMKQVFFRSFSSMGSFNYKGYNNLGYVYSIMPALEKIYEGDEEGLNESLARNCEFFNSHPYFSNLIMGISLALEEQKHEEGTIDGQAITATKSALMGPLAGIGDSVFQGTFRTIFSAVGAALAMQGNLAGPWVYLIPNLILAWGCRWGFLVEGYKRGIALVAKIHSSDVFQRFVDGATAMGVMVIASITCSYVSIAFAPAWDAGGTAMSLQGIFDAIMPKLPEMLCLFLFYKIMKKDPKGIYWCLIGTFVVGILGKAVGLF